MGIYEWIIILGLISLFILFPIGLKNSEKDSINKKIGKVNINNKKEYISRFEKVYSELYESDFEELNRLRKINERYVLMGICMILILFAYYSCMAIFDFDIPIIIQFYGPLFVCIIVAIPLEQMQKRRKKQYSLEYKKSVFLRFMPIINETFLFKDVSDNDETIENLYKEVNFSNEKYEYLKVDDYIVGEIDDNLFRIADVYTYDIVRTKNTPKERPIFKGLFSVLNLEKSIPSEVELRKVKNDFIDNIYLKVYEYQHFENNTYIYSNDNVLVNKLVASGINKIIDEYYERFGIQFEIILKGSKIYMKFYTGAMFEPPIYGNILNKENLYFYYYSLILITELSKEIKQLIDDTRL